MNGTLGRSTVVVGLLCVSVFASVGCWSHRRYPQTWPAVLAASQPACEEFAGSYHNKGINGADSGQLLVWLAQILPITSAEGPQATDVTLSFPAPEQMHWSVSAGQNELVSRTLTMEAGQYFCRDGRVTIRNIGWKWGGSLYVAARIRDSTTLELYLADDYLAIKRRSHKFALLMSPLWVMLPVPATRSETEWYRFERSSGPGGA